MGLEAIAAPLVAAAGNMAGGAAASALMGDTSYPKGGGIPGLTSANTGKSGTTPAVQIDPATALSYFQSAGNSFDTNAMSGLSYYNQAIQQAGSQLSSAYSAANTTLKPLSQAGQEATNQYMRMLGLDAMSPTVDVESQVRALGNNDLADQIAQAEKLKDPTQRQAAKESILNSFQQAIGTQNDLYEQQKQKALTGLAPAMDWTTALNMSQNAYNAAMGGAKNGSAQAALNNKYGLTNPNTVNSLSPDIQKQYNDYISQGNYAAANATIIMGKSQQDAQNQANSINNQYSGTGQTSSALANLMSQYNSNYSQNQNYLGYTGQEVTDQLRSTPGYQFQLDQGLEGINRAAAAGGMLSSGNTLLAANNYAQNYADNAYQGYLGNLNTLMGLGTQATMQTSANQIGLGTGLATLSQSGGQAGLNTYQNIGQALYNAYTNMGQTWNQDTLANMAAQNAMISQGRAQQLSAAQGNQTNATANGYLNLNAGMLANTMNNQQQQAQAFNNTYSKTGYSNWKLG